MNNTPNLHHTVIAFLLLCTAFAAPTSAGTLFYNGGPKPANGYEDPNYWLGADQHEIHYENFDVPAGQTWTATGAFAHIAESDPSAADGIRWEIRTGLDGSTGGTLLHSGTETSVISEDTDYSGTTELATRRVEIAFADPIELLGGKTYWLAVTPRLTWSVGSHPSALLLQTNGDNAINSPESGSNYHYHKAPNSYASPWSSANGEYSLGLTTTATAPEPSTALLLLGLAPVLARRPRRRNRG